MALGSYVTDILRELAINIALLISGLIGTLYDVILSLGTSKLFTDDFYVNFATKIGLLLGIYMLFKLMFSLINYLIDPDKINDKKEGAGKIVVRVIVVIVLLATYNTLFRTMYDLQDKIMTSDFFPTLFFDQKEAVVRNGGKFALQYAPIMATIEKAEDASPIIELPDTEGLAELYGNGGFGNWFAFHASIRLAVLQKANIVADSFSMISKVFPFLVPITGADTLITSLSGYAYHFNAIPCLLFAGFLCYSMFVYAIKTATRVAQLALLQLIAPVPIISYVDPKSDSLKKWAKMTFVSYVDVFVRMAIVYFVAYFSYKILDTKIGVINNASFGSEWLVKLLIMCGVLIMANKFPDLLKKIFNLGDAGEFGLSVKNAMGVLYNPIRKNAGMIGGAASAGIGAAINGGKGIALASAIFKGGAEGRKSGKFFGAVYSGYQTGDMIGSERARLDSYGKLKESDIWNSMYAQAHGQLTLAQQLSQEQEYNSKIQGYSDSITANAGKFSFINEFKDNADTLFANGSITETEHNNRIEAYKEAKKAMVDKILNNSADLSGYETLAQYEELTNGVDKSENYADSREAISIKNAAKYANELMDEYNSTPYFKHKGELSHITSNSSNNRVRKVTLDNSAEFDSPTGELAYQKRVDEATKSGNFKLPKWFVGGPGFHGGPGGPPPGGPPPGGPRR